MKRLITSIFITASTLLCAQDSEWDDYFMPGIGFKTYHPKNSTEIGTFSGVMSEFVIYAHAKGGSSRRSGPSRVKTYGNVAILKSNHGDEKNNFASNLGLNLSFEGKSIRNYFIPYFGLEIGGLYQRDFSTLSYTPLTGIQLVSTKSILWNVQGGYLYTNKKFDEYSGFTVSSTLNILLWNHK